MQLKEEINAYYDELVSLRRHFHEFPEVSGKEENTLSYIKAYFAKLNCAMHEVKEGGLLVIIDSAKPGKTLLMRADIDALPIAESTNNLKKAKACISTIRGVSHACGHDCHMAMNMIAGKYFLEHKDAWSGKLVLCFERGEECGGNIKYLLPYIVEESGLKIDGCYATHVRWDIPSGKVTILPDAVMSGGCGFTVKLTGAAGHGSRPDLANNPLDCFVAIYQDLNSVRMRQVDPHEILTFSLGLVQAGSAINIIPEELTFGGTCRFFSLDKAGKHFIEMLEASLKHNCELYGCTYEILNMPLPLYEVRNNTACTKLCQEAVRENLGDDALYNGGTWMASESYALFLQEFPGVLTFTGIQNAKVGSGANHHTSEFDVDERGMLTGAAMAVSYGLAFFNTDFDPEFTSNPEPVKILATRNL